MEEKKELWDGGVEIKPQPRPRLPPNKTLHIVLRYEPLILRTVSYWSEVRMDESLPKIARKDGSQAIHTSIVERSIHTNIAKRAIYTSIAERVIHTRIDERSWHWKSKRSQFQILTKDATRKVNRGMCLNDHGLRTKELISPTKSYTIREQIALTRVQIHAVASG
ncbi:hypothetical protein RND71_021451 [Anisodus tanguticus]|uniref:Uncharacterized protein n=1 Tax=Anisodus tanguticus TaxID=243964 RepID=A0AAE1RY54_9SOLA|nr:hypothetical protein RND71_021451 [Anisodus tanguticus]